MLKRAAPLLGRVSEGASDIRSEPWFPAAATSVVPLEASEEEQLPEGIEAYEISLPWTTLTALSPTGNPSRTIWWKALSVSSGGWGRVSLLDKVESVLIESDHSGLKARLDCGRDGLWMAEMPPFDIDGNARRLADLADDRCHAAEGGIQWAGRDVLVLRRDLSDLPTAADALRDALIAGDHERSLELCRNAGEALGRFHSIASKVMREPPDANRWNDRLKRLEECTKSSTLWRAPHSKKTESTITLRGFSLEQVVLLRDASGEADASRPRLVMPNGGIREALMPLDSRAPALRDVAAGYGSIEIVRRAAAADERCAGLPPHGDLRMELLEGWISRAPRAWSSDSALDSHRGGVPIWEYEHALESTLLAAARGEAPDEGTRWFLDHVDRIQATMFRSRILAAGAVVAVGCAALGIYSLLTGLMEPIDAAPLILLGLAAPPFRHLYRRAAPPPA